MSKEGQPHEHVLITPVELTTDSRSREGLVLKIQATSEEALEAAKNDLNAISKAREIDSKQGNSRSFGFTNWNSPWNPKGPQKRPWMNPENPSKN